MKIFYTLICPSDMSELARGAYHIVYVHICIMYIYIYAGTKIKTPDIYIFSPKIWLDFIFKTMEIDEISCVTGNKNRWKTHLSIYPFVSHYLFSHFLSCSIYPSISISTLPLICISMYVFFNISFTENK